MGSVSDGTLWLLDADGALTTPLPTGAVAWRSLDGALLRCDARATATPGAAWTPLEPLQSIAGASEGVPFSHHYVVEADVAAAHERDFNDWYEREHLPGLAAVPGTVRAMRYRRPRGTPRYLACYDLLSPRVLEHPRWLAVRHTVWSARIRPLFLNPRRTMFTRAT
jgi:hypothetical protein